jgi:GTP pyrophosphokinase
MNELLAPIVNGLREHHPQSDLKTVERAFETAFIAHTGQLRKSGEDYITHPVAVTQILVDLGLDQETIIASLLHDTVEDTPYSLDQLRTDFGDQIAALVDGVTKLDKLAYGPTAEAETVRNGDRNVTRYSCPGY